MTAYIITATDTDVGKTLCAALLMAALKGEYWKPVQCGTDENGKADYDTVRELSGLEGAHFIPPVYSLSSPLSPHRAAELENIEIDLEKLRLPPVKKTLLIEGAGGLMVPLNRNALYIDLFQKWTLPVVLCARTGLGTINHTLLSLEALRTRSIPVHGIVFVGDDNPDNRRTIVDMGRVRELGWIPQMEEITKEKLMNIFNRNFDANDWK